MATNKNDNKNTLSDKQLFLAISNGNHEAFSQFLDTYKKHIYGFLYKQLRSHEDVEELVQIVFIKIWENRTVINHELSPNAYVFKIAKNCALDMLRQRVRRLLFEKKMIDNFKESEDGEANIVDKDLKRYIDSLITNIPERRREIFKLRYEKELSYREIAKQLVLSEKRNTPNLQNKMFQKKNYCLLLAGFFVPFCNCIKKAIKNLLTAFQKPFNNLVHTQIIKSITIKI